MVEAYFSTNAMLEGYEQHDVADVEAALCLISHEENETRTQQQLKLNNESIKSSAVNRADDML